MPRAFDARAGLGGTRGKRRVVGLATDHPPHTKRRPIGRPIRPRPRPTWGMRWREPDGASCDDPAPEGPPALQRGAVAGPERVGEEDDPSPSFRCGQAQPDVRNVIAGDL